MKVLFITGFACETDSANINCINQVVQGLQKKTDVKVTITGEVLKAQHSSNNWRKKPSFMIRKILQWPVIDPDASRKCYEQIVKELEKTKYDVMIVSHMPYDAVRAAVQAKRRFPNVHLMLYELDPITYEIDKRRNSLGRYLYFMRMLAEKKTYIACDTILHMECNRRKYTTKKYDRFSNKSLFLDFPLIHDMGILEESAKNYEEQTFKLIYAGKMMEHFRSPEYLLKVLERVQKQINIEVEFYSNGDCERILEEYATRHHYIHQLGYVDKQTLMKAIEKSDCLINIGNKYSDMLPSKLLTYIENGKPILHVQNQLNDTCLDYLKRYGLAVVINEDDPIEESSQKIVRFVHSCYGARVGSNQIISQFNRNTPEYTADQIIRRLLNKRDKGN